MYILYNNYFIIIKYCRQFIETALHTLLHQVNFRVYLREKLLHFYCKKSVFLHTNNLTYDSFHIHSSFLSIPPSRMTDCCLNVRY